MTSNKQHTSAFVFFLSYPGPGHLSPLLAPFTCCRTRSPVTLRPPWSLSPFGGSSFLILLYYLEIEMSFRGLVKFNSALLALALPVPLPWPLPSSSCSSFHLAGRLSVSTERLFPLATAWLCTAVIISLGVNSGWVSWRPSPIPIVSLRLQHMPMMILSLLPPFLVGLYCKRPFWGIV